MFPSPILPRLYCLRFKSGDHLYAMTIQNFELLVQSATLQAGACPTPFAIIILSWDMAGCSVE